MNGLWVRPSSLVIILCFHDGRSPWFLWASLCNLDWEWKVNTNCTDCLNDWHVAINYWGVRHHQCFSNIAAWELINRYLRGGERDEGRGWWEKMLHIDSHIFLNVFCPISKAHQIICRITPFKPKLACFFTRFDNSGGDHEETFGWAKRQNIYWKRIEINTFV